MTKHHLQMVVMSSLFTLGLAACTGGGSSLPGAVNLPNTVNAMGTNSASSSTTATTASALRATSAASTTTASYLAIDSGSTAGVGGWVADKDFTFTGWGEAASYTSPIDTSHVSSAPPQSVYQSNRWAPTITYTIPALTPNSAYTIRLHFAECWFNSAGQRLFNVSINGSQVLTNFDIFQTAGGENIAIAKSFTANADASGKITIYLSATVNNALISGIELTGASSVPTPAPGSSVVAISAGNPKAVGSWLADTDYTFTAPGAAETFGTPVKTYLVTNPAPQAVYQSERWAKAITYAIPRLTPNGAYTVRLSFVESFFAAKGLRLFNVAINGTTVLTNFDIFATAGGHHIEITRSFATNADANGKVTIALSASVNDAVISGVEVTGATIGATPTPVPTTGPPSPTPAPIPTSSAHGVSYPTSASRPYPQWPGGGGLSAPINEAALKNNVKSGSSSAAAFYANYSGASWDADSQFASNTYAPRGNTYFASNSDPMYTINCESGAYCGSNNVDSGMSNVHIPVGARTENSGSGGCDCHLYLIEPIGWIPNGSNQSGTSWPNVAPYQYIWEINDAGYGSPSCAGSNSLGCTTFSDTSNHGQLWVNSGQGAALFSTAGTGYLGGTNSWNNGFQGDNGYGNSPPAGYSGVGNASASTYTGLQITAEDMLQGAINHEQDWYVLCAQNGDNDEWPSKTANSDATCNINGLGGSSSVGWHYGGHVFLQRTDVQIASDAASVPLNALQVIEAKALAHYGAIVGDTSGGYDGSVVFSLNIDNNDPVWTQVAHLYPSLMNSTTRSGNPGYNFPIPLPVNYIKNNMVEANVCIVPGSPHYNSGTGNCGNGAP